VRNSFVYIDDVSTNEAAASPAGQFSIHATDDVGVASVHYSYSLDGLPGDEVTGSGPNDMTFTIPSQPNDGTPAGDGRVTYWAVDTAGNIEVPKTTHVSIDGTAPDPVTDLTVTDDGLGDFTLNWTAPGDMNPYGINQVAEYEVRYSTSALDPTMSDATWDALPTPTLYNLTGLPGGGLRAPRIAGAPEVIRAHVNNGPNTYYFGVRSYDRARNRSGFDPADVSDVDGGSLASSGGATGATTTVQPGDVVVNEVMWTGSIGHVTDEWIELRNMTDVAIDVSNWVVENLGNAGTPNYTIPSGTVITANGFLTIARFAESDSNSLLKNAPSLIFANTELLDGGEQLTLRDATSTLMDQTPAGAWPAGSNGALRRSMERTNQPGDGTTAANWHHCTSLSCLEVRTNYWDVVNGTLGTPGGANMSLEPTATLPNMTVTKQGEDAYVVSVQNVGAYQVVAYQFEYDHMVDGEVIHEGAVGEQDMPDDAREFAFAAVRVATCSAGETCVSHEPISNIKVTVTLTTIDGGVRTMVYQPGQPIQHTWIPGPDDAVGVGGGSSTTPVTSTSTSTPAPTPASTSAPTLVPTPSPQSSPSGEPQP
jgi:hypothetical protein